uniref:LRAT domain-containing protein n=1 Tax=Myotis myotis TaxID=51298 RepID=A0A7J7RHD1_MYOMY|nr:hypothetical protein mMyoMyo1_006463 [Myotis myotis]
MGLSPDAGRKGPLCPSRFPRFGPKPTSRTAGREGPGDAQPAPDIPLGARMQVCLNRYFFFLEIEESLGFQVLVQLSPKQGLLEPGEKPGVASEPSPRQRRTESSLSLKSESASQVAKQAAEGNPRPRPGDLIEIFRIGYEHWAICVEGDRVVHLAPPSEEFVAGSITSIFSNRAVVKCSRLEDVLHGCSWKVNNKLDGTYLPLPVDKILQRTRNMVNKIVQYSLIDGNCEHFVNDLRYGVPRSQQVEQALMQGAKAAGAMLSAVVESIRPKAVTASSDSGHHAEEEPGQQQRERPPFAPLVSLLSGPV